MFDQPDEYISLLELTTAEEEMWMYLVEMGAGTQQYGIFVQPTQDGPGKLLLMFDPDAPLHICISMLMALQEVQVKRSSPKAREALELILGADSEGDHDVASV